MKQKLLLFLIPIFLFSFDFKTEYVNHNYNKICKYGMKHIQSIKKNENLLSLVGFSCVKDDSFIYLPTVMVLLKKTKKARENSVYFSILFMEKKLLISKIIDGLDISYYRFPLINHPLSIVVNSLIQENYKENDGKIIIQKSGKKYEVYKTNSDKVFIKVYENNKLKETHWYR